MGVFKATGLRYRINIVSGGKGVYILSGVKEKRQESEINTIVLVFQLLLAGIVSSTMPFKVLGHIHYILTYRANSPTTYGCGFSLQLHKMCGKTKPGRFSKSQITIINVIIKLIKFIICY